MGDKTRFVTSHDVFLHTIARERDAFQTMIMVKSSHQFISRFIR